MPSLRAEVIPATETTTELTVEQRELLLMEIAVYEAAEQALAEAEADVAAMKVRLDKLRAETGEKKLEVAPGTFLTEVTGKSSSLDKKGLMKHFKITPEQWASFVRSKDKKPYLLVTTPTSTAKEAAKAKAKPPTDERDDYGEER